MSQAESIARTIVDDHLDQILAGEGQVLVDSAEQMGKALAEDDLKMSQVRRIFTEVRRLREFEEYDLHRLRARLAYVAGRHKEVQPLEKVCSAALKRIDDEDKLRYFRDFFEAIVAYIKRWE